MQRLDPGQHRLGHHHRIGSGTLGHRQGDGGAAADSAIGSAGQVRDDVIGGIGHIADLGDIGDIDRATVTGGQQQVRHLGGRDQGFTCHQLDLFALVAQRSGIKRAVGLRHLARQLLQRHPVKRQLFGVGRDADRRRGLAHQIGQTDVFGLGDLSTQLARDPGQGIGVNPGLARPGRERKRHDRHVINAAPDHQRLGYADRDAAKVGAQLVMHPQHGGIGGRADQKPRRHHRGIVAGLGIDVIHPVKALDDGLERFCHQLYRILGAQALRLNEDIDQRHRNLRLFLARQRGQRHQPDRDRGQNEQRRQGRSDEAAGQGTRDAKVAQGATHRRAPARRPPPGPTSPRSCRCRRSHGSGPAPRCGQPRHPGRLRQQNRGRKGG